MFFGVRHMTRVFLIWGMLAVYAGAGAIGLFPFSVQACTVRENPEFHNYEIP